MTIRWGAGSGVINPRERRQSLLVSCACTLFAHCSHNACTWLHNPLVMNVSTRGSAESVIVALVLLTIHLYQQKVFLLTGLVYGLAIHLKIYPLIFCLSLYVPLTQKSGLVSLFDVNVARYGMTMGGV